MTAIAGVNNAAEQPQSTTSGSETEKVVVTNGRVVTVPAQNGELVASVVGRVLTDADIQRINREHIKLKKIDVTGATLNGSLVVSRKAIAILLPDHPEVYVEGIYTNIAQEVRKLLSESAQGAFDTFIARAKASFTEKFPRAVFDSAEVQSPTFVAEHGVSIGSFAVGLAEASPTELALIQGSPDVRKKVVAYLKSTPLQDELNALIKEIVPSLCFENLRSVDSLNKLLPILKKYETGIEEYMLRLANDPRCAFFKTDVTETITKLKGYQHYLWLVSLATWPISKLLGLYPNTEVVATVERYKRLFAGILAYHLMLEPESPSPATSHDERKAAEVPETKESAK